MEDKILASIIIRAYNEEKNIGKLLSKIKNQKVNFKYEIIVVDSGSTDKTVEIAKRFNTKVVNIKPKEFSFGFSLNKGIEASLGDICVFISAHCFPEDDRWLKNIVLPHLEDEKIALVYGRQRGNFRTKFSEKQIFKQWFPNNGKGCHEHPFCNNANSSIKKKIWNKVKFDEVLTGLEDIDWAKKVISMGYKIFYNPDARIIHVHNETWQQIMNRYKREAIAFYTIFPKEHFGILSFVKYFLLNVTKDFKSAFAEGVFKKEFLNVIKFRYFQFLGTYKGARYKKEITEELKKIFYYRGKN